MVKQLIAIATFLIIQYELEIIHYVCIVLDFTMLAQYPLYNNKTLFYMDSWFI